MPAGEVGTGDVTYFTAGYQIIQCPQRFFNWGIAIKAMQVINIDMIGLQALKTVFS